MLKKFSKLVGITFLLFVLVGCGKNVETLKNWDFQYNNGSNNYSLFFGLADQDGKDVSAPASIDIRIEDDFGDVLYEGQKTINEKDFDYYTSNARGTEYLANVIIGANEISEGKSSSGKVYFTVSGKDFYFDECSCDVFYDLPTKAFDIAAPYLPTEMEFYSWDGSLASSIVIEKISATEELGEVVVTVYGEKTYGSSNSYENITYRVKDESGYVVDSGYMYLGEVYSGDKFKEEIYLFELIPGEKYTIEFSATQY